MRRGTLHDLERLLRALALAGASTLVVALAIMAFGALTNVLVPVYGTTPRFLAAVLVVTAPYAELLERRSKRLRELPLDERLGFAPGGHVVHESTA